MSPSHVSETIFVHPALAGRTLLVRNGAGWAAFEIQPEGRLGEGRPIEDPSTTAWRGGSTR